jgi:hypothetical protein
LDEKKEIIKNKEKSLINKWKYSKSFK